MEEQKYNKSEKRKLWIGIFLILFLFIFAFSYYGVKFYNNAFFSKVIFSINDEGKISDYKIVDSSLGGFLTTHPIEALKNCKYWDSVNEEEYNYYFENSKVYHCSILKYEPSQFLIETNLRK